MNQDLTKTCVICHKSYDVDKGRLIDVKTQKTGLIYTAHEECLEGLYLLLTKRGAKQFMPKTTKKSCTDLIQDLYFEEWFSDRRMLPDVMLRIQQKGYNFSKSTVANSLRKLVRADTLARTGEEGNYQYIQKRPPGG